jgi:uncharacterized membrane protein
MGTGGYFPGVKAGNSSRAEVNNGGAIARYHLNDHPPIIFLVVQHFFVRLFGNY